jgi:hypothetical protein
MSNKFYELKWRKSISQIQELYDYEMKPIREILGKKLKKPLVASKFTSFYSELIIGKDFYRSNQFRLF